MILISLVSLIATLSLIELLLHLVFKVPMVSEDFILRVAAVKSRQNVSQFRYAYRQWIGVMSLIIGIPQSILMIFLLKSYPLILLVALTLQLVSFLLRVNSVNLIHGVLEETSLKFTSIILHLTLFGGLCLKIIFPHMIS